MAKGKANADGQKEKGKADVAKASFPASQILHVDRKAVEEEKDDAPLLVVRRRKLHNNPPPRRMI